MHTMAKHNKGNASQVERNITKSKTKRPVLSTQQLIDLVTEDRPEDDTEDDHSLPSAKLRSKRTLRDKDNEAICQRSTKRYKQSGDRNLESMHTNECEESGDNVQQRDEQKSLVHKDKTSTVMSEDYDVGSSDGGLDFLQGYL